MLDPILAEDSTYTKLAPSLEGILNDLGEGASHHDYLVALLIVLLAESGFYTSSTSNDCSKCSRLRSLRIPKGWKKEGTNTYEMKFQLDEPANVQCKLVVVPLGDTLIINFIPFIKYKSIYTISVQTLKYVNPYSSDRYGRYMNLKAISHRVKDSLCTPVRSNILHTMGLMGPSLQALPTEVKLRILGMLDVHSLLRMSQCCSEFHELCSESQLWKALLLKDFPEYGCQGVTNSKKFYRMKYQNQQRRGSFRSRTHRML
ncbi:F-box only protein 7 [Megachile rotundata]|uniref:F-box only protein 7 n=1 Tax=Megachile rotundata TaxID=143995 RepID=UPI003FD67C0D